MRPCGHQAGSYCKGAILRDRLRSRLVPPRESIWVHWPRLSAVIDDPAIPSRVQLGVREGSLLALSSSDWVPG